MSRKAHLIRIPSKFQAKEKPLVRSENFAYSKKVFLLRLGLISVLIIIIAVIIFSVFNELPPSSIAIIMGLLFFYLILSVISPFVTNHTLTPDSIIIRQGWYFRTIIPFEDVESIEETREFVPKGVKFSFFSQRIYVTGSGRNLVKITLKQPRRFFFAMGKLAREVIIDVKERERFISQSNRILESLRQSIPSSPGQ